MAVKIMTCRNPKCLHEWPARTENGAKRCPRCQRPVLKERVKESA